MDGCWTGFRLKLSCLINTLAFSMRVTSRRAAAFLAHVTSRKAAKFSARLEVGVN